MDHRFNGNTINSLMALGSGLTSYNFNVTVGVRRMVDFIVSPPGRSRTSFDPIIEFPGFIVERGSSGVVQQG